MTKTWKAVLAPVGVIGKTPQVISPNCEITVRDRAPLLTVHGDLIGHVADVSISDGYLTATGVLLEGSELPTEPPTFDMNPCAVQYTIDDLTITFEVGELIAVRTGFTPVWVDELIAFVDRCSESE